MKIIYLEDKFIIFINNNFNIDFNNIKEYFKKIFLFLKEKLDLEFNGSYLTKIYKDNNIGTIIEIYEELDYYENEIDMKVELMETIFLYEIEDIFINKNILNNSSIFYYKNKLYLKLNNIKPIYISYLYEIGNIIYKNTENIIKYGREIHLNLV